MRIGNAVVWVEDVGGPAEIESTGDVRTVAPDPSQVFDNATTAIRECVRIVAEKMDEIAEKIRPQQVTVEFSVSFDASGKASVIPIFLTGETKVSTGLKVTAVWKHSEDSKS
jgi:hypothetical protein